MTTNMSLVSADIERYAEEHSSPLPPLLTELVGYTRQHMDSPEMLSGPIEGMLLYMLAWTGNAKHALDVGTFTGFSALMVASALPDDGRLVTCEAGPEHARVARQFFDRSPNGHKIELREGPALETMQGLSGPFDLVFIDADKTGYPAYYERSLELLAPRGIIAVDNTLRRGRVLQPNSEADHVTVRFNDQVHQDERVHHVLLPIRDGVMLVCKRG